MYKHTHTLSFALTMPLARPRNSSELAAEIGMFESRRVRIVCMRM